MIKKFLLFILIAFVCFFGIDSVYANTQRIYMSLNNYVLQIGDISNINASTSTITNRVTLSELTSDFDNYSNLYIRYSFCSNVPLFSTLQNVNVVNTNISCITENYDDGKLSFLTSSYDEDSLTEFVIPADTDVVTSVYDTSLTLYSTKSGQMALFGVDIGRTLDSFPTYDSSDSILNKLDSLNYTLDSIKSDTSDILKYLLKMFDASTECRDSKNLLKINSGSYSLNGVTAVFNSDGSITLNGKATANTVIPISDQVITGVGNYSFGITTNYSSIGYSFEVGGYVRDSNGKYKYNLSTNYSPRDLISGESIYYFHIFFLNGASFNNFVIYPQLEKGTSSTTFEPYGEICKSKLDVTNDAINETNKKLDETNKTLNDSDTSESSSEAGDFFEGFNTDTHGLTGIVTAPLELIGNLAGSTCSPLPLDIPFVGGTLNLPCMSSIYKQYFGNFLNIYQIATFGMTAYWVCVKIFALVKDFKNPEHDEIEVLDL